MNGWEIAQIALMAAGVGMALVKHGEPKTGNWSFPISLTAALIQAAILYMAGLWH